MSSLSIGIVGLPNVGKSTLFNALTRSKVLAANYPFATIEPNTGIVSVPDDRLGQLAQIFKPEKVTPATVTFTDIAGLVAGAHKGEGLGNQFLAHIRETAAIAHVVRAFKDTNVTHVNNDNNPQVDIETINTELILADLATLESAVAKLDKQAKANPKAKTDINALKSIKQMLDAGQPLFSIIKEKSSNNQSFERYFANFLDELKISAEAALSLKNLLTAKAPIYVFNIDESTIKNHAKQRELIQAVSPIPAICVSAQLESELADLEPVEAKELLNEYGLKQSGLEELIKVCFQILGLQTYLTAGPKEVRAWTIEKGATAPQAAGVIHTDFERGFIAAEIVNFKDLIAEGSKSAAKAKGLVRTEGKDYIMQDGDVVEFRFNV
jgi:GTP-binding protein YchF